MADFRYAQYCPLTRAVEILGERWTVLLLRELFLGPKRFIDLKTALNGVSTSVLAERLVRLEERGIVSRRDLPPPAASSVYELDEAGRALKPVLVELTRWGARFLDSPGPSDCMRPEWLLLGLDVFARREASPDLGARLQVEAGNESIDIYVRGGAGGTKVSRSPLPFEVSVRGAPLDMLVLVAGHVAPVDASWGAKLVVDGDVPRASQIASLFDFSPTPAAPPASPELTTTNQGENR